MSTIQERVNCINEEISETLQDITNFMHEKMNELQKRFQDNGFFAESCFVTAFSHTLEFENKKQLNFRISDFDSRGFKPTMLVTLGYKQSFVGNREFIYEFSNDKIYQLLLVPRRELKEKHLSKFLNPVINSSLIDFLYRETVNFK